MQIHDAGCQHPKLSRATKRNPLLPGITAAALSFLAERGYDGSPATARNYRAQLAPFLAYCEAEAITALEDVEPDFIRAYLRHEQDARRSRRRDGPPERISRSTLRMRHTVLSIFLSWCVEEGKIKASPMLTVSKPRGEKRLRHGFDRETCQKLLATAKEAPGFLAHRDTAIILLLLDTGARASELANLKWSDVHWGESTAGGLGFIEVYGKGRKARRLKLGKEARRALRRWQEVAPKIEGDWVWVTIRRTKLTADALRDMCQRLGEYAGVEHVHPHRFGHTFAAEFTRANRDVYATKARLGHEKLATTEMYLHSLGIDYGADDTYKTPGEWLRG